MNKIIIHGLVLIILFGCGQNNRTQESRNSETLVSTEANDTGFKVFKTRKLVTVNATKPYSTSNRQNTQYSLDKNSRIETRQINIIKISEEKVIITDANNQEMVELSILNKWIDESGPSTVYDLVDQNGVEYSLNHYVDYYKKNFLAFRFGDSLKTYTDE